MEECMGQGMGKVRGASVATLDAPPSQQLDVFTNLEALRTSLFRVFMEVLFCRHDW